jgi:hypothetical protein
MQEGGDNSICERKATTFDADFSWNKKNVMQAHLE